MPKILLYAAAALLFVSACFGWLNRGKISTKQAALANAIAAQNPAQNEQRRAVADKQKAERAASDVTKEIADIQATVASAKGQAADLTTQLDAAKKSIQEKDAQIATLNDAVKNGAKPVAGPVTDTATAHQLEEAQTQRDELVAVKNGLESQLKTAQAQLASAQKQIENEKTMASMNGLRGRVLAVDRNWNFVVVDLGNRNGVVNNATLIVQRGASLVGRIRITTVEPSQSIADIIPNTVPEGISVQPGDTVVFPGT